MNHTGVPSAPGAVVAQRARQNAQLLSIGIELPPLEGTDPHVFDSVAEALPAARRIRPACALLDLGREGIEVARRLWEIDGEIRCVLMAEPTASWEAEIERRLSPERFEAWDFLPKPCSEFELRQRMQRSLAAWNARREQDGRIREDMLLLLRLGRAHRALDRAVREGAHARDQRHEDQTATNPELERTLRKLEQAQSQLLQQEKMASIGQLAAGVAHELNNPIGYVHSNLGTLGRYFEKIRTLIEAFERRIQDPSDGGAEEIAQLKRKLKIDFVLEDLPSLLNESLEGTERVSKIVSDLKIFSHPSATDPKYADINAGLQSTLNIVWNDIKYKAEVKTEFGDIPAVKCLPSQINQVFMNLLVNAAQAVDEGGEITLRTRPDGDFVIIEIIDNGCGIPEKNLSQIFDPFFTTKEVGKGTGLGLSISCDIVRKHGGEISVESVVGEGTTFRIRLPLEHELKHELEHKEEGNAGG